MFSSFSFKIVDCFSAVTEFRELFSVKSVALLCCWDYRTVNSGKIPLTHTAGASYSKIIVLEMRPLTWSLFCHLEWKPAYFTLASPPLLKERRVERWTSNAPNSVPEREHFLLPPLFTS